MDAVEVLEEIRLKAMKDAGFRAALLKTREAEKPISEFCRVCAANGFEIYEMDLISAGEDAYAAMRRSTNGGGENSPLLRGEDDAYEALNVGH